MDGGWVWGVGQGNIFGAFLVVFGLGGGKGCVCLVCATKEEALAPSSHQLITAGVSGCATIQSVMVTPRADGATCGYRR